ncbi:MAG: 3-methyl-2-oxobutanoate hydroxymethyltransferase [Acidimicrobiia bacterium]
MTRTRPTVADLQSWKGTRQLTNVYVDNVLECVAAEAAGIDIITVQDSIMSPAFRHAAPTAFMVVGLEYGQLVTTDDYLRGAFDAINTGADACWSAASLETISRMRAEGIPVVGHVGLIPPRRTWTGGFRAVGKTAASAQQVWDQTRALEEAGAFAAEIEVVPEAVATEISRKTSLVMISMGSGAGCDAQYLFSTDILGTNTGHIPRHAKTYGSIGAELDRVQQLRIDAFKAFADDVAGGTFPDPSRLVGIDRSELEEFQQRLDTR